MEKKTNFRSLSPKAKIEYIWDYYRWHIIFTVAGLAIIVSFIYHYVTYQEPLLNVIMINSSVSYNNDKDGFKEFLDSYDYDAKKSPISLASNFFFADEENAPSSSYMNYQALTAMIAAGDEDLFFGNGDVFLNFCNYGVLTDLSDILSPELLAKYEDRLIYASVEGLSTPYPCAIDITGNTWITKYYYPDTCYFGIFHQNQNVDVCRQFAEFLLTYE